MRDFNASAILAVFLGVLLLPVLFAPYVAWTYRRLGTFSWGRAVLDAAALFYVMALWTSTVLPLPDSSTMRCPDPDSRPQLVPFASLAQLDVASNGLADPTLLQLLGNVALFIPFGMLARHLLAPRRPLWVVVGAFGASLLIELTQLTGIWGLYPCAYRVFDVDDLITNTIGGAIGVALAPLLRYFPGQRRLPGDRPRVVTRGRRLLGMAVDLASVSLTSIGGYLLLALLATRYHWFATDERLPLLQALSTVAVSLVLLLVVPWSGHGATLGQRATLVRPVDLAGDSPRPSRKVLRWAAGSGGFFLVSALATGTGWTWTSVLATLWLVSSAAVVLLRDPRGISGFASGLIVTDSRDPSPLRSRAQGVDPRRMGIAVVSMVTLIYVGTAILLAITDLSPTIGFAFGLLAGVVLLSGTVALVPYLAAVGVIAVRKEGLGRVSALPLLVAAALACPPVLLGVAIVIRANALVVAMLVLLAVTGYFGFLFLAFLGYGQWYARQDPVGAPDAIVVLGSRVFDDRVPPLLASRLDRGIEVLDRQLSAHPESSIVLVCSGGQGDDETMPEGEAMARYCVAHGVAGERVIAEKASRTTLENLTLTHRLLEQRGLGASMLAVTNDFHAFRAAILARRAGLPAQVIGAPTAHYYFPAAVIREFIGVLSLSPVLHGLTAVGLAVAVGLLSGTVLL